MQWPWHPYIYGKVTLQGHGTHTLLENQMNIHVYEYIVYFIFLSGHNTKHNWTGGSRWISDNDEQIQEGRGGLHK